MSAFFGSAYLFANGLFTPKFLAVVFNGVAVGHAIGRLGCIGHGCCTGRRCTSYELWTIAYRDPAQRINRVQHVPESFCVPTVIFEVIGQFAIALVCLSLPHLALPIWLVGYGCLRTMIQAVRAEQGDVTRVAIAAGLIAAGCFSIRFVSNPNDLSWNMPSLNQFAMIVGVSALIGASFGLRFSKYRRIGNPSVGAKVG